MKNVRFVGLVAWIVYAATLSTASAEEHGDSSSLSPMVSEFPSISASAQNSVVNAGAYSDSSAKPTIQQTGFEAALRGDGHADQGWLAGLGNGLLSLVSFSDHAFDGFIEPATNPVFFEDPRSRTRLRFVFINQLIPEDSILAGGDFQLYATQLTVALNERFAIIAQKDGYIELQADGIPNAEGHGDFASGFKYVLVRDTCHQFLLTSGIMYEWSQGSSDVFQGNGDGVWNFFLTTGKEFDNSHFVGTLGWHLPNNGAQESESMFYSLHLDHALTEKLYALWEMTGIQYLESGRRMPGVNVEGGDLINLGAGDVAGNHFVSMAFGLACKLSKHLEASAAWEFPITGREDLLDSRTTVTLSWVR